MRACGRGLELVGPAEDTSSSPIASIHQVLVTLAVSLLLSLILGARGMVHSGNGMPDGPERTVTLAVGQTALQMAEVTHLTWPWDHLQAALGRKDQPSVPPLLLASSDPTPLPTSVPAAVSTGSRHRKGQLPGRPLRLRPVREPVRQRRTGHPAMHHPLRPLSQPPRSQPLRQPTLRNPLRLLVTGDSLIEFLGSELVNEAARAGAVRGFVDIHYGTGLVRPDFVDWSLIARQQAAADRPDAVVVFMGGNDFQNMTLANGRIISSGTPAWTREYQRRAAVCMRIWVQHGARRVYWLSLPPARSELWARHNAQIDLALRRAAARVPGAEYLDILGPITDHGRYADFVDVQGQSVLVREPDGIHLTMAGSTIVAHEVMQTLKREWHL